MTKIIQSLDPKRAGHLKENAPVTEALFSQRVQAFLSAEEDDNYTRMNRLRNWFNGNFFPVFELYLEDVWNEASDGTLHPGETRFEYILRHTKTADETGVLAYDTYKNHQDAKGVWHLGEYISTTLLIQDAKPFLKLMNQYHDSWEKKKSKNSIGIRPNS